jgi:tetratricopeptide (TPR) repeat protein
MLQNLGQLKGFWVISAAMMVALVIHWPSRNFELLLYDDPIYVSGNPQVTDGFSLESLQWAFTTGYFGNWHPLTWLSLQWDVTVGGGTAKAFHTTNLVLHVATTGVLAFFFRRLTGSVVTALIAATLFGIHPMHVESVAWVSERKGLLSTFFLALSLVAYLNFVDRPDLRRGLQVMVCFAMSLMSKQMGVTLPLLLPLLHGVYFRGDNRRDSISIWHVWKGTNSRAYWALYFGLFINSAIFALIAYQSQSAAGALMANERISLPLRLATAMANYFRYLGYYAWPSGFSFNFPSKSVFLDVPYSESFWLAAGAATTIGVAVYAAYRLHSQAPILSFAIAWYLIAFLPVIGILQVGNQVIAMRYSDWPLIGVHLAVARGMTTVLERLSGRWLYQVATYSVVFLIMLFLGLRTRTEAKYWAEDGTLYRRAIEVSPQNFIAHSMLGRHYMEEGNNELAIEHLKISVAIRPDNAEALSNLALLQFNSGDTELAWKYSQQALESFPDNLEAHLIQGMLYTEAAYYEQAEQVFKKILEANPKSHLAWFNLASVYRRQGRQEDAIKHYEQSLQVKSTHWQTWHYLAECLESVGNFDGATMAYGNAIGNSAGSSLMAIRNFVRIRLVCGSTAHLESLVRRLQEAQGDTHPIPERIQFQISNDSQTNRGDVIAWTESQRADLIDDPFVYEVLGDAHEFLGNRQVAEEMWSKADSLWPPGARMAARHFRQSRIDNLAGRRE